MASQETIISERKPGLFIPTLYFAEGLPYTIVMMMSGVFFKTLGADNVFVGLTSFLGLPWILKFAWAPLVDYYATKRSWVVTSQYVLAILIAGVAAVAFVSQGMPFNNFVIAASFILFLTAFASATQDISIDGYYLDVLNEQQKAFFVGVRNAAYKVAWLFGSGGMVFLAGKMAEPMGIGSGWAIAFAICAVCMMISALFHHWYLPRVTSDTHADALAEHGPDCAKVQKDSTLNFWHAISSYFQQPGIAAIVIYILVFRLGDALMLKQAPNFLLDPVSKGGLAVSLADIGIINGTVGMITLLVGGILGSWLLSKGGLKRWMWPLALFQNGAILLYWVLAQWPHFLVVGNSTGNPHLLAVYVINSIEQFAYGMGVAAYTVFLLSTVKSEHKAAHYATATALMALGMMIPQGISGYLTQLGYANFFLLSFFASLPGLATIFFLPIWHSKDVAAATAATEEELVSTADTTK
jgi:MFS transporter, PAT family, beta-lactamase induction signal transducer AmpG